MVLAVQFAMQLVCEAVVFAEGAPAITSGRSQCCSAQQCCIKSRWVASGSQKHTDKLPTGKYVSKVPIDTRYATALNTEILARY